MTWGPYFFFYECPECGKKYRWPLEDMNEDEFSRCPSCNAVGTLAGETKDVAQGETKFMDYEYI